MHVQSPLPNLPLLGSRAGGLSIHTQDACLRFRLKNCVVRAWCLFEFLFIHQTGDAFNFSFARWKKCGAIQKFFVSQFRTGQFCTTEYSGPTPRGCALVLTLLNLT